MLLHLSAAAQSSYCCYSAARPPAAHRCIHRRAPLAHLAIVVAPLSPTSPLQLTSSSSSSQTPANPSPCPSSPSSSHLHHHSPSHHPTRSSPARLAISHLLAVCQAIQPPLPSPPPNVITPSSSSLLR
ncbi:uncharacterized protein J3R85_000171 [Psidium guajava]|nr:uncharacterized protein J3R85_000171 [Psidium guajava]